MTQTTGTAIVDPVGHEIGGLIASIVQVVLDSQYTSLPVSIQGIRGTDPPQFINETNAITGVKFAKTFIDAYTNYGFDDSQYPNAPLGYEYHMRDIYFVWRKQRTLTSAPDMRFTIGKDAIIDGSISTMPIFSDFYVAANDEENSWQQTDKDTSRRWGGRRFWGTDTVASSFVDAAQALAVRAIELFKHERKTFTLETGKDAFFLYPGDIIDISGGESIGVPSGPQRIAEVEIQLYPTVKTRITVGDPASLLTDYL